MHIETKALPVVLQRALAATGFGKRDIAVEAAETFRLSSAYGTGYRAFAVLLNMETGESTTLRGSWGGENPFAPQRVDVDQEPHAIPVNGAAIMGQEGGGRPVSARIVVRPDAVAKFLPAAPDVTDRDRRILATFGSIKAGPYRQEALRRIGSTDAEIGSLVARGFLKVASNGATSITTAGKNARGNMSI